MWMARKKIIKKAYERLARCNRYSHCKLLAEMEFGVWKYMFNNVQYRLSGRCLLNIFPDKPKSTQSCHYDNTFVYNELDKINNFRNRIAHHEPICFGRPLMIDTRPVLNCYAIMKRLLGWMGIDSYSLLYGIDHVVNVSDKTLRV